MQKGLEGCRTHCCDRMVFAFDKGRYVVFGHHPRALILANRRLKIDFFQLSLEGLLLFECYAHVYKLDLINVGRNTRF